MATPSATTHELPGHRERDESSSLHSSESGSSYVGSDDDDSGSYFGTCRWRTAEFHNQECSRYFDCPSHSVERLHSSDGADQPGRAEAAGQRNPRGEGSRASAETPTAAASSGVGDRRSSSATGPAPSSPPEPTRMFNLTRLADETRPGPMPEPSLQSRGPPSSSSRPPPSPQGSSSADSVRRRPPPGRAPSEIVLPRWQPDAEVTLCPICHNQFSIFVRKHHCRKCGRVVCNSCSPHRITIPHQYIVRPPGHVPIYTPIFSDDEDGSQDFGNMGGGERVRLCNPCVPDPNTTPPQPQNPAASPLSPRSHQRSQSSLAGAYLHLPGSRPAGGSSDAFSRSRSVTLQAGRSAFATRPSSHFFSAQSGVMAGTPPTYLPSHSRRSRFSEAGPSSSQRALPPAPPIAEEDECPVCHRELPSQSLPNSGSLREAHITSCIAAHSDYHGGSSSAGPDSPGGSMARSRRSGTFPYLATEKDCVDSAECTICLEEFEVGVPMARLECLCRFHRSCISAWFVNHPGRCPVHQHDGFGF